MERKSEIALSQNHFRKKVDEDFCITILRIQNTQETKVQKYSSLGGGGNYLAKYKSVMHMDKGNSKTVKRMFSANQKYYYGPT